MSFVQLLLQLLGSFPFIKWKQWLLGHEDEQLYKLTRWGNFGLEDEKTR